MWNKFIIKKGNHFSGFRVSPLLGVNKMGRMVFFGASSEYDLNNPEQQESTNKLFGFSYGYHKKNSLRFGWRYNLNERKIEVLPFIHDNGKMIIGPVLGKINPNEEISLKIIKEKKTAKFISEIEGNRSEYSYSEFNPKCFIGYKLYPYFGGMSVSPHNIEIFMKKILF